MSDKLKPCPLCWGEAKLESRPGWIKSVHYQELWTVSCTKCTLENTMHLTCPEDAIYRWNRRPIEDALSKRVEELERTVDDLRGDLMQSDRASDAARVAELEAEREKFKLALERIIASKNCSIFSDCNRTETCLTLCYVSKIADEALKGGE